MRILVLDGHTLNPGDNPWSEIEKLGNLTVYARTEPSRIVERALAAQAEIVLTNKTSLDAAAIAALPDLKFVAILATGHNLVDGAAAAARGIPVSNVPTYGTQSVAQHTLALLLELANRCGLHDQSVHDGDWTACPDFSYWKVPVTELTGRVFGVIGGGTIGVATGRLAEAFGMEVWVTPSRRHAAPEGWIVKETAEIFRGADAVSLHCPQTAETTHFVNRDLLKTMKPTAFLLNTARGGLIDEAALAEALEAGLLAGAGLDVVSAEPVKADNPLLHARNCVITPHIAWSSLPARRRLMATTAENIRAFLRGEPANRVN